jgi:hypothetical protein
MIAQCVALPGHRQPAPVAAKLYLRLTARQGCHFQLHVSADAAHWQPCGESVEGRDLAALGPQPARGPDRRRHSARRCPV